MMAIKMRLIDANELKEHVYRDRLDSRERIANLIDSMPTVQPEPDPEWRKSHYEAAYAQGFVDGCKSYERQPDFDMTEKIDKAHDDGYKQGYLQGKADYERKPGKWINGHWDGDSNFRIDGRGNCWLVRECSNCHEEIQGKPTKYCPNCGCIMEGDTE